MMFFICLKSSRGSFYINCGRISKWFQINYAFPSRGNSLAAAMMLFFYGVQMKLGENINIDLTWKVLQNAIRLRMGTVCYGLKANMTTVAKKTWSAFLGYRTRSTAQQQNTLAETQCCIFTCLDRHHRRSTDQTLDKSWQKNTDCQACFCNKNTHSCVKVAPSPLQ